MLFRILKKDLQRRKGVNFILFVFIMLATVFLASSVNNILVVSSAVDYYMDYAKVPDVTIITNGESEKKEIKKWFNQENKYVKDYGYNTMINLSDKSIYHKKSNKELLLDANGASPYIAVQNAEYCKVYDEEGKPFTLKKGEIAIGKSFLEQNGLKKGDRLVIRTDGMKKSFTLKVAMKDAAFGNDMIGMRRLMVSEQDFKAFKQNGKPMGMYHVSTDYEDRIEPELNKHEFKTVTSTITKSNYNMVYSFDMILAGLLILIGICLILIALLVLRFTLVFTMEEAYQEIGIMKAVGLRDFAIKKIYLMKYAAIVIVGSCIGIAASYPVSKVMVKSVSSNMIMKDSSANPWPNVICGVAVIGLILLYCYFCTKRLNKVSAVTAMRGGQTGQRYGKRRGIQLNRRKHLKVPAFLGINDIATHVRRFIILMITFCISFILITIPLNTVNTMKSDEMAANFLIDPASSICVKNIESRGERKYENTLEFENGMRRIEKELKDKGYQADLTGIPMYFLKCWQEGQTNKTNLLSIQILGKNDQFMTYDEGTAPLLTNEIAFSKDVLEENKWNIGDSVKVMIGGKVHTLIITGAYSDYMQLGKSARLNSKVNCSKQKLLDYWAAMVKIDTDKSQETLEKELTASLPDYNWLSAQSLVDQMVGGIKQTLDQIMLPMTIMLCGLIMLITILMEKLFIVREKGEIAMMKSIGFRSTSIQAWQILRLIGVVIVSMAAAVPLSLISNQFVLKPIFAIMGADLTIQVVPWQVYGLYPAILLMTIIAATIFSTRSVKKISIWELNNLE